MEYVFNIAICDDDGYFVDFIEKYIVDTMKEKCRTYNIAKAYSGNELIAICKKEPMDILFLDVDMPEKNGFLTIEEIYKKQPNLEVVFITNHSEYAYQAFDYHPYQFIHKNDLNKIPFVLHRLCEKIIKRKTYNDIVHLEVGYIIDINLNEVVYVKSNKNYVEIFMVDGFCARYRAKIMDIYTQLQDFGFIYPQRSYVVNCKFIDEFDRKTITLKNGVEISVSRDDEVRKEAQHFYGMYMRNLRW